MYELEPIPTANRGRSPMRGMRARAASPVLACVALSLTAAACDDPTGPTPADVAGSYELVEYQGNSLPTQTGTYTIVEPEDEVECTVLLRSGSLDLEANSDYTLSYDRETECDNGALSFEGRAEGGSFEVSGETIRLSFNAFLGGTDRTVAYEEDRIVFLEDDSDVVRAVFERTSAPSP